LAAAVATVETVEPLLPPKTVGIDWPNDVMVQGRKLAGILVEVLSNRHHIVGIGLNTNNSLVEAPPELRPTATTLLDLTGTVHDQTTMLVDLLNHLESNLAQLAIEPEQVGRRADALCSQRGKMLTLHSGGQSLAGRCVGIAPDGAFLLETAAGRQAFYSGVLK
jgi:BirA family biotin operon repressor/biotin-[acetyl-CoA-carboxylase] ligase